MLKSVSKCEKLQKGAGNLQKGAELRSNKCAKCVKRLKVYEDVGVKMGGLEGQKLAGREAGVGLYNGQNYKGRWVIRGRGSGVSGEGKTAGSGALHLGQDWFRFGRVCRAVHFVILCYS